MKKILAFIASGIIPTFIPICALLTLPVCVAEKYIPHDVQKSFSYGIRFFQLVLNPSMEAQSETVARKVETVPVVESTVTSMAVAAEVPCEDMGMDSEITESLIMSEFEKHQVSTDPTELITTMNASIAHELHKAQQDLKHLEIMRDLKIAVPAEKVEVAWERALQKVEAKVVSIHQSKKKESKASRVMIRKKAHLPA